jgi:hypothetical protein
MEEEVRQRKGDEEGKKQDKKNKATQREEGTMLY